MENQKEKFTDVFNFILSEETDFRTRKIPLASNWEWNMYDHIDKSFMLCNSMYANGDNQLMNRPFNNLILPIRNVNLRSEGFDVKNIELYVDDADYYHLSLISRKYHNKWAIENSVDTAIDDSVESYFDYGLALAKNVNEKKPQFVDLKAELAFCDQSNVLAGAICLKHDMSIDELLEMKGRWYADEIDRAIRAASFATKSENGEEERKTNKSVLVYELHGVFPNSWLTDKIEDEGKYSRQMHIVTYYVDEKTDTKLGICLFKGKSKQIFKALVRDKVSKRACGRGGIEELIHPQVWANYSEIQIKEMLDAAALMVIKTTDKTFAQKNKLNDMKRGKNNIVYYEEGKDVSQLQINAANKSAFDNLVNKWEQVARTIGSASDPQLGLNPTSGTPLGTTQIVTNQGVGIHEYRQGKIATFWGEIYRDWVLEYLTADINRGDQWLDELTVEELQEVAERVSKNQVNKKVKDIILSNKEIYAEERDLLTQLIREEFIKGGRKKFIKAIKDEFSKIPLKVKFNIVGKQKDLADIVKKLNGVFASIIGNPQILQMPGMAEMFNEMLEMSGLSPINFTNLTKVPASPTESAPVPSPMQPQLTA